MAKQTKTGGSAQSDRAGDLYTTQNLTKDNIERTRGLLSFLFKQKHTSTVLLVTCLLTARRYS